MNVAKNVINDLIIDFTQLFSFINAITGRFSKQCAWDVLFNHTAMAIMFMDSLHVNVLGENVKSFFPLNDIWSYQLL